ISTDGLTLGANVMTPINGQLTLFARLGYFDWNASYSPAIPNPEVDSGSDFLYGAGILVGWDNLKFKAGYTRFKVDKFNVDVYGGGFQYYFPVN
ncbi:MAG: hypothetical protein R3292_11300, partial [Alcanivorax sp.]|nr:hypothetical protein [Alcanivorax sp.]